MAVSFLAVASLMFVSTVAVRTGSHLFDVGRQLSAQFGWASSYVSQTIPLNHVIIALPLPTKTQRDVEIAKATVPKDMFPDETKETEITPALMAELGTPVVPPPRDHAITQHDEIPQIPIPQVSVPKTSAQAEVKKSAKPTNKQISSLPPAPRKPFVRTARPQVRMVIRRSKPKPVETLKKVEPNKEVASLPPASRKPVVRPAPPVAPQKNIEKNIEKTTKKPIRKKTLVSPKPEKFDVAALVRKAKAGVSAAQLELAQRYQTGMGVRTHSIKAVQWYQRAAQQGVVEAQFNLGLMHYLGEGTPKNLALAYRWVSFAAQKGNQKAKAVLKTFNQSLPAPVFTAMVFPQTIILGAKTPTGGRSNAKPRIPTTNYRAVPVKSPASIQKNMTTSTYWKPNVYLLGNKPLP